LRLATEALQADPASELALRVQASANLEDGNFGAALAAVEAITKLPAPSAAGFDEAGDVLFALAGQVAARHASIDVDADTLRQRARDAYDHAVRLDGDNSRAWAGLANLQSPQDRAAAEAFVARAQPVLERRPDNDLLARALALLCARTGQGNCAYLFGVYWRSDALSRGDLEAAQAFMQRLKQQ